MKRIIIVAVVVLIMLSFGCAKHARKSKIFVFHAGSLSLPFKIMEEQFEKIHPEFDVIREGSGSRKAARKISDLHKRCEIMASADYSVIDKLLIEQNYADWNVHFATNEMVIAYFEKSKFAQEINSDNWYKILLRKGVNYGHSDPNADPCGYRTMLVWQLAETYYKQDKLYEKLKKNCPEKNIRSAEVDLIALLETGELDYLFIYRSVAKQHDMKYITLPDQINLKNPEYSDFYKKATIKVTGKKPGEFIIKKGAPMVYGFTIPSTAQNKKGAELFAEFILSDQGRKIMEENGQPCIVPPIIKGNLSELPSKLKKFIEQ